MQHIQDKELDKLFQGVFDQAEIKPSEDLWSGINAGLAKPKKTRKLPLLWLAAASVAIVLMLTISKQEKVQLSADLKPVAEEMDNLVSTEVPVSEAAVFAITPEAKKIKLVEQKIAIVKPLVPSPAVKVEQAQPKVIQPTSQPEVVAAVAPQPEQVVYAQIDTENITSEVINENEERRNGIRNVGDLVNLVVGKFDKRERKAIKFKTDDDDSSLIGLNIGILKFNAKRDR